MFERVCGYSMNRCVLGCLENYVSNESEPNSTTYSLKDLSCKYSSGALLKEGQIPERTLTSGAKDA